MAGKFPIGKLVWTRGVHGKADKDHTFWTFITDSLRRHAAGDWGDLDKEDRKANDNALERGDERLLSAYKHKDLPKIWVITEWDRSVTTVLFPDEY